MTADPLADVLRGAWLQKGNHYPSWAEVARAAREHIAAEIEARYDITEPWNYGVKYAARIARGQA